MLDASCCLTQDEIRKIYDELDLHEKGITQEEITRRKTRIFVGGLKFASEDHVLHDYFSNFGKIKEAVVIRDRKTGLSKGYGFVTMVEDLPALKAILDKSPKLDGRRCNVNLAYIGQKNKPQAKTTLPKPRDPRQISPQLCGYPNGIMVSPPVLMPDGQYYQYGTPPPSYYQPVYQVVSPESQSPPPYDNREVYSGNQGVPVAAAAMYPGPIVVGQPIIIDNPANPGNSNNNNIYLTNNIYYRPPEGGIDGQTEPVKGDGKTPLVTSNSKDQMQAIHLLPHGAHILPIPPMAYPFTAMEPMNCTFTNGEVDGIQMTKCDPSEVAMITYQTDAVAAKKLMLQHPSTQQQPTIVEVQDEKSHNNV